MKHGLRNWKTMNLNDGDMKKIFILLTGNRGAMPVCLSLFLFFAIIRGSTGQTIIAGTTMKVVSGCTLALTNHLTIQSGAALVCNGTAELKGNLVNQNPGNSSLGSGTVSFSGPSSQVMSGQNVIQNLGINNPAGVTIAGNTRVNGVMTLTSGITSLGNSNLTLGNTASIAGAFSLGNMIAATGTGQLQKMFSAVDTFSFPVGDADGIAEYSPVILAFKSGSFGVNSMAGVNLADAQYGGTSTSYLTRYWNVSQSGITDFSCSAYFQYPPADVEGTESDIFSFKVDPALPWTAYNAADVGIHLLRVSGLSAFGTFTGNIGNASIPPAIRSLQDKTVFTGGMSYCADALQTLLIAGNGTSYVIPSGVSVSHIAGQNIIYYPGTKVNLGGYLHGYISTTFCTPYHHNGPEAPVAANTDQPDPIKSDNSFFKIYPNPTPGKFTLELKGDISSEQAHIDIFGILGEKILSKEMILERTQEFSLADRPTGVYVIHVSSGANSKTEKIIKQ